MMRTNDTARSRTSVKRAAHTVAASGHPFFLFLRLGAWLRPRPPTRRRSVRSNFGQPGDRAIKFAFNWLIRHRRERAPGPERSSRATGRTDAGRAMDSGSIGSVTDPPIQLLVNVASDRSGACPILLHLSRSCSEPPKGLTACLETCNYEESTRTKPSSAHSHALIQERSIVRGSMSATRVRALQFRKLRTTC